MTRRDQDQHNYARDMDTGKEVHHPYIELDPHGTSQPVYNRNSAYAPESVPHSDLEAVEALPLSTLEFLKNDGGYQEHYGPQEQRNHAVISSKPLPPPPATGYETAVTAGGHNGNGSTAGKKRGLSRKTVIIAVIVSILAIIAIVVGAVVGTRSRGSNHQGGDQDQSNKGGTSVLPSLIKQSTSTNTTPSTPSSEPTSPVIDIPDEDDVKIGSNFTASFTFYGSGDGGDGENCKNSDNACGIPQESGYAAGVSQNLYGDGVTCGTCWRLHGELDGGQDPLNRTIVVKVNEICPAKGYPICGQKNLRSTNQFKAQVNFNLCVDTGASDALFGFNTGVDFATGTAQRVDCKEWEGKTKESFRF